MPGPYNPQEPTVRPDGGVTMRRPCVDRSGRFSWEGLLSRPLSIGTAVGLAAIPSREGANGCVVEPAD